MTDKSKIVSTISTDDDKVIVLPTAEPLAKYVQHPPPLYDELIKGLLRCCHKMLISGSSKAGKSFLLMELCIAIAEGIKWLGFDCKKGKVLYVNLEIDPASAVDRFLKIYKALGVAPNNAENIVVWNLRGHSIPLDKLVPILIDYIRGQHFDAVIIDPIYKVITGDENSATDMAFFCNQFDKICAQCECSVIYVHHHSKGGQGNKKAIDRASGSGVFARDPDAVLDIIQLELTDNVKNTICDNGATGWRLETNLREFPNVKPVNFWFEYPIHVVDKNDVLTSMPAQGTSEAGQLKNKKFKTKQSAEDDFKNAFNILNMTGEVTVKDMEKYLNLSDKTIYSRISKIDGFSVKNGKIIRTTPSES